MRVLLVQPPFVQLNAPYPAVAYLAAFCRREGHDARCLDLSIELFRRIFCAQGLQRVFAEAEKRLPGRLADLDVPTRSNVLRYLSNADDYVRVIDPIVRLLSAGDDAFAHELAAARRVPWGHRAQGFLEANDGEIGASDAPMLASLIVEDLADFIRFSLDSEFALVRYAESKASSQPDFAVVEAAARDSFLFEDVLPAARAGNAGRRAAARPCRASPSRSRGRCRGRWPSRKKRSAPSGGSFRLRSAAATSPPSCAACATRRSSATPTTSATTRDTRRSPGSWSSPRTGDDGLFKTIVRRGDRLVAHGFDGADLAFFKSEPSYETREPPRAAELRAFEDTAIRQVFPDFAGLDFSRYVRIVEGTNPMHALWSGAAWMKARLAYGCYWRRCAFCDTSLEYIARFAPSVPDALFDHLLQQSRLTGQRGVHFVDEAMPVGHLLRFGLANLRARAPAGLLGQRAPRRPLRGGRVRPARRGRAHRAFVRIGDGHRERPGKDAQGHRLSFDSRRLLRR